MSLLDPDAVCLVMAKTVAVLLDVRKPVVAGEAQLGGTNESLGLLESLGKAVAEGAEADESLDEISAGSVELKVTLVCWFALSSHSVF